MSFITILHPGNDLSKFIKNCITSLVTLKWTTFRGTTKQAQNASAHDNCQKRGEWNTGVGRQIKRFSKDGETLKRRCLIRFIKQSSWVQKWYWLNNIDNINSVVSFGRLVRNRMLLGSSTAGCCTAAGTTVEKQITNLLESIYFVFSTHWQVEIGYYHNCETQKTVDTRKTCTSGMLMCCKGKANTLFSRMVICPSNLVFE